MDFNLVSIKTHFEWLPGAKQACVGWEESQDLLGAIKARVTQTLSSDNMADAVEAVAAVVLTVLSVCAVGAAHLTPAHRGEGG